MGRRGFLEPGDGDAPWAARGRLRERPLLDLSITVRADEKPPFLATEKLRLAKPDHVDLPGGLQRFISGDRPLPAGLRWQFDMYLPLIGPGPGR